MAGAAPTSKPAPFLRPLDTLDRGVLLAESALSLVVVVLMLFAAVSESAFRLVQPWPAAGRVGLLALLWLGLTTAKLAGAPGERAPAQDLAARLLGQRDAPRTRAVVLTAAAFVPVAVLLGWLTERAMRAVLPHATDILMHGTMWAAFLGASFATRGRKHLAIDAVSRVLPDRGRRFVVATSAALGAFIAFVLAQGMLATLGEMAHQVHEQVESMRQAGITTGTVSRAYEFQYVIPGGFLLIGIRLTLHSFHEFVAALAGGLEPANEPTSAKTEALAAAQDAVGGGAPPPDAGVASAHEDEAKMPAPTATATVPEVAIAFVTLGALVVLARGTTLATPMLAMAAAAALSILVPVAMRYVRGRSFAPPHTETFAMVRGRPVHFALAALAVAAILAVMRYGLAPRIEGIPTGWGVAFFALMALMGAPLFSFLGGLGIFLAVRLYLADPSPIRRANAFVSSFEDITGNHFATLSVLATIPLFTLAGYIMSESRMPQRLVRVSRALLGALPGGLAVVCVFASAFFTIFSGASGITIVAVGGLLLPALIKDRYPERFSMGLVTTGGALGITIPPCLPLIVYGIVAGLQEPPPGQERLDLQRFLLAGIKPGLLAIGLMALYCIGVGAVAKVPRSKFDAKEAGAALWEAKWELALPLVLLVGLAKGIFNSSQAAAFTAFYVFVVEVFVYKDLSLRKDLPRIVPESMVLVGAIFVKLAAATVLVGYFVQAQTADKFFEWLTCGPPAQEYMRQHAETIGTCREAVDALARAGRGAGGLIDSRLSFLIALNVFLLIVGMLMDIFSAIVIVVPLIVGIATHFDINPYHLGVVFLMNLEIGYLMPPMGLNLFIAGFRFNRPVPDLYRVVLPFIAIFIVALMITTYVPQLTVPGGGAARPAVTTPTAEPVAPATGGAADPGAADAAGTAPLAPPSDCDEPREGESFEDFERRCLSNEQQPAAGGAAAPAPAAAPQDCEEPREGEPFDDFARRCQLDGEQPAAGAADSDGGGAGGAGGDGGDGGGGT